VGQTPTIAPTQAQTPAVARPASPPAPSPATAQVQPPPDGRRPPQPGPVGQAPAIASTQPQPPAVPRPAAQTTPPPATVQIQPDGRRSVPAAVQGIATAPPVQPQTPAAGGEPAPLSGPAQTQQAADGRRPSPDRHRSTPAQAVAVDATTSVVPRGDRNSFDIRHQNPDGSQIVLSQTTLADGTKKVTGFKQTVDARDGTTTRVYADGRRVTEGRDFEHRTVGSGLNFVSRHNGLREAVLADGRPVFQDRFTDGGGRQVIERTRYARWSHGRPEVRTAAGNPSLRCGAYPRCAGGPVPPVSLCSGRLPRLLHALRGAAGGWSSRLGRLCCTGDDLQRSGGPDGGYADLVRL
jgi:hypothetical protein